MTSTQDNGWELCLENSYVWSKLSRTMRDAGKTEDAVKYQEEARYWVRMQFALRGLEMELPEEGKYL